MTDPPIYHVKAIFWVDGAPDSVPHAMLDIDRGLEFERRRSYRATYWADDTSRAEVIYYATLIDREALTNDRITKRPRYRIGPFF